MVKYVIIGASAAGLSAADEIRKMDADGKITIISMDDRIYSRCMIHHELGGERTEDSIRFVPDDFFEKRNITWMGGKEVMQILEEEHSLLLDDDSIIPYDKLLIASGSINFIPSIPNFEEATNIFGFCNLENLRGIERAILEKGENCRVVVVGGGLVGMDAAYGLTLKGMDVTVVEMVDRIMPLVSDAYTSAVYQEAFEKVGCKFRIGVSVKDSIINEENKITHVILSDGEKVECDFVVIATSVKPQLDFLKGTSIQAFFMNYHISTVLNRFLKKTDLQVKKGLEVNEYMETSAEGIYAAGDVTGISNIWPDAKNMGRYAAYNMCGYKVPYLSQFPNKNTCTFFGIAMVSLGKLDVHADLCEVLTYRDQKSYKKLVIKGGCLQGAIFLGDVTNTGIYLYLMRNQIPIEEYKKKIFTLSFADFYGLNRETLEYEYKL